MNEMRLNEEVDLKRDGTISLFVDVTFVVVVIVEVEVDVVVVEKEEEEAAKFSLS